MLLAVLIVTAFGSFGALAALRTGSTEAVHSLFPVFFVFLFISSMNLPRNLIEIDWFRHAATANPVSYLIEGIRSLVIEGWNAEALGLAFAISNGLAIVGHALALPLRPRLGGTEECHQRGLPVGWRMLTKTSRPSLLIPGPLPSYSSSP